VNKVLLIFYGGTELLNKKGSFISVEKESDIEDWVKGIPEISLMVDIKTLFLNEGNKILDKDSIKKLIHYIEDNINNVDGVVILNSTDTIPLLANQLFWQIQNPNKPIVITGSNVIEQDNESLPDLSFKANLINAFQIVNSDLNEISVIYGDRVISPSKIVRVKLYDLNIFKSINKEYLARIDFGLSIKSKKVKKEDCKYYYNFNYDFLFFEIVPELKVLEIILDRNVNLKVIVFRALPNQVIERKKLVKVFNLARRNKKLVIFYNQIGFGKDFFKDTILTISRISSECLTAKLSWILGQTKDDKKIRNLLKNNVQEEFLEF